VEGEGKSEGERSCGGRDDGKSLGKLVGEYRKGGQRNSKKALTPGLNANENRSCYRSHLAGRTAVCRVNPQFPGICREDVTDCNNGELMD